MYRKLAALVTSLFLFACAHTDITAHTDPSHLDFAVRGVAVITVNTAHEVRTTANAYAVQALKRHQVNAVVFDDVLPPTREYTIEERRAARAKWGYNAALYINIMPTQGKAQLIDSESQDIVWMADFSGDTGTYAYVDAGYIKTSVDAIINELVKAGHLPK